MDTSGLRLDWITRGPQRLALLPAHGGVVAGWQWHHRGRWVPLWRDWNGDHGDRYAYASFPMLPWANRISTGGFEWRGRRHEVARTVPAEACPIHGCGWLHPWQRQPAGADRIELALSVTASAGQPWCFDARQALVLRDDGLVQELAIIHRGAAPMPYGLGFHPWLPCPPGTVLQARVGGLWWRDEDGAPPRHRTDFPPGFRLDPAAVAPGPHIDHGYTGWDGHARVRWPDAGLALHLSQSPLRTPHGERAPEDLLVYRPAGGTTLCIEPQSHAVDAFHLPGRPGLVELEPGQQLAMQVHWRVEPDG